MGNTSSFENYLDLRWDPSFGLSQLMSFLTGVPSSSMLASATRHNGRYLEDRHWLSLTVCLRGDIAKCESKTLL